MGEGPAGVSSECAMMNCTFNILLFNALNCLFYNNQNVYT